MTEDSPGETYPDCPTCGVELAPSVDYVRGHKTSDGYECNNDDCPEDWWHYTDWYEEHGDE